MILDTLHTIYIYIFYSEQAHLHKQQLSDTKNLPITKHISNKQVNTNLIIFISNIFLCDQ